MKPIKLPRHGAPVIADVIVSNEQGERYPGLFELVVDTGAVQTTVPMSVGEYLGTRASPEPVNRITASGEEVKGFEYYLCFTSKELGTINVKAFGVKKKNYILLGRDVFSNSEAGPMIVVVDWKKRQFCLGKGSPQVSWLIELVASLLK